MKYKLVLLKDFLIAILTDIFKKRVFCPINHCLIKIKYHGKVSGLCELYWRWNSGFDK